MKVPLIIFGILYFLNTLFRFSHAWDNDELEVFDVVEEVNQNFYDVLGVTQVISSTNIFKRCQTPRFQYILRYTMINFILIY